MRNMLLIIVLSFLACTTILCIYFKELYPLLLMLFCPSSIKNSNEEA